MSKIISISIDVESLKDFDDIVEASDSDRSKMLRKWIREHKQLEIDVDINFESTPKIEFEM